MAQTCGIAFDGMIGMEGTRRRVKTVQPTVGPHPEGAVLRLQNGVDIITAQARRIVFAMTVPRERARRRVESLQPVAS